MQTSQQPSIKLEANRIAAMNKNLSDLTTQLNNEVSMLSTQLGEKGKEISTIKARLAEKDRQLATAKKASLDQEMRIKRLEQSAGAIMDGAAQDKSSAKQRSKVAKLEKTITTLTEENKQLDAKHTKISREFKEVVNESANRWKKIRAMRVDHDIDKIRFDKTVAELSEELKMKFGADVLESRKRKQSDRDTKHDSIRQENLALRARNKALMEENDRKHAENAALAREYEDAVNAEPETRVARLIAPIHGDGDQNEDDCNLDSDGE